MKYQYRYESDLSYFIRKHGIKEWIAGMVIGGLLSAWLGYLVGMALDK